MKPITKGPRGRRFRTPLPDARGSTLLEVMIGVIIVAIVSIAMSVFFARGRYMFDQEERKRVGTLIAQEALEDVKQQAYAAVGAWTDTTTVANVLYNLSVTVQNNSPSADMKTVRATVTWPVRQGVTRNVSLATLIYDK